MSKYRNSLPQLGDKLFITDSGLETTLIFNDGLDLPHFAAFDLLKDAAGTERLRQYYTRHALMARDFRVGMVLEAPTWRATPEWAGKLGYDAARLKQINVQAIELMLEIRDRYESSGTAMVISGNIGPRGDGYSPSTRMSVVEARNYHLPQIRTFSESEADMVSAFTMNYVEEAIGVAIASRECGIPAVISFTVETDGNLPSGETLEEAIRRTDAETDGYPAYYMINCAHPTHFMDALDGTDDWRKRIRGVRTNASRRSHAELDGSNDLDAGDPLELGELHVRIKEAMPWISVLGGCCGTDLRHVACICDAVISKGEGRHAA
jgi:homocysteine S-methyltransferase